MAAEQHTTLTSLMHHIRLVYSTHIFFNHRDLCLNISPQEKNVEFRNAESISTSKARQHTQWKM